MSRSRVSGFDWSSREAASCADSYRKARQSPSQCHGRPPSRAGSAAGPCDGCDACDAPLRTRSSGVTRITRRPVPGSRSNSTSSTAPHGAGLAPVGAARRTACLAFSASLSSGRDPRRRSRLAGRGDQSPSPRTCSTGASALPAARRRARSLRLRAVHRIGGEQLVGSQPSAGAAAGSSGRSPPFAATCRS